MKVRKDTSHKTNYSLMRVIQEELILSISFFSHHHHHDFSCLLFSSLAYSSMMNTTKTGLISLSLFSLYIFFSSFETWKRETEDPISTTLHHHHHHLPSLLSFLRIFCLSSVQFSSLSTTPVPFFLFFSSHRDFEVHQHLFLRLSFSSMFCLHRPTYQQVSWKTNRWEKTRNRKRERDPLILFLASFWSLYSSLFPYFSSSSYRSLFSSTRESDRP